MAVMATVVVMAEMEAVMAVVMAEMEEVMAVVMADTASVVDTEDTVVMDALDMIVHSADVFTMEVVTDVAPTTITPHMCHHTLHPSTLVQTLHQFTLAHTFQLFMSDHMYQASITVLMLHYTMLDHTFHSFTCHHLFTLSMQDPWDHQCTSPHHQPFTINHQLSTINLTLLDMLQTTTSDIMLELEEIMEVITGLDTDGEVTVDTEDMAATDSVVVPVVVSVVAMEVAMEATDSAADMAATAWAVVMEVMAMVVPVMVVWVVMMENAVKLEVMVMDTRELSNKNDRLKVSPMNLLLTKTNKPQLT